MSADNMEIEMLLGKLRGHLDREQFTAARFVAAEIAYQCEVMALAQKTERGD